LPKNIPKKTNNSTQSTTYVCLQMCTYGVLYFAQLAYSC